MTNECLVLSVLPSSEVTYSPVIHAGALVTSMLFSSQTNDIPGTKRDLAKAAVLVTSATTAFSAIMNAFGAWESGNYCWLGPAATLSSSAAVLVVAAANMFP